MQRIFFLALILCAAPALAHPREGPPRLQLIIDTDAGLDDMVALSLCLQEPRVNVRAITLTDGLLSAEQGAVMVGRLLAAMGRPNMPLYIPSPRRPKKPAPIYRAPVLARLQKGLPPQQGGPVKTIPLARFTLPEVGRAPLYLLALGPMGSVSRLLSRQPTPGERLWGLVAAGAPGSTRSWNARFDPEAWTRVARMKVKLSYLVHGDKAQKPARWAKDPPPGAAKPPNRGGRVMRALLAVPETAHHYAIDLDEMTDELPLFFVVRPDLFARGAYQGPHPAYDPTDRPELIKLFVGILLKSN